MFGGRMGMTSRIGSILGGILLLGCTARATVITFDDLPNNTVVTNQYAGFGVLFEGTAFGVKGGISEGDSGNWGLEGTNGPHFLGFNGNPSYSETLSFTSVIESFSLDAARSNGSSAGDQFMLEGFLQGSLGDSQTITFGAINSWTTVSLTGQFDQIVLTGIGQDVHPYGVDNLIFEKVVPEPASKWTALGGLIFLAAALAWKRRPV
jgi:hypothetical protein